jgi:hypothetical protein
MLDIIIGLAIVAALVGAGYVITHRKPATSTSPANLAQVVSDAAGASWEVLKADLPAMVSSEIAQLRADKAALTDALNAANAKIAADKAAHAAALSSVAARVAAAVTAAPELPPSPVIPAVAAAQADDLAAVTAAKASLQAS